MDIVATSSRPKKKAYVQSIADSEDDFDADIVSDEDDDDDRANIEDNSLDPLAQDAFPDPLAQATVKYRLQCLPHILFWFVQDGNDAQLHIPFPVTDKTMTMVIHCTPSGTFFEMVALIQYSDAETRYTSDKEYVGLEVVLRTMGPAQNFLKIAGSHCKFM